MSWGLAGPALWAQKPIVPPRLPTSQSNASAAKIVNPPADPTASAATSSITPLTVGQKVKRRELRLVEPVTLLSSAFGAGIEQARHEPKAWPQGGQGYAIRWASAQGFNVAHNGVALAFDLAMHTDPRYRRLPAGSAGARVWNAVSQSFLAYKDSGGRTVNMAEIGGNFGAGVIANAWNPPGNRTLGDGLERGALGLMYHTAKNIAREFLPDFMHRAGLGGATGKPPEPGQSTVH
jgi:hypothetical protein